MVTKLRLLGIDSVGREAALEVGVADVPPTTAFNTAANALGTATYGSVDGSAPKPSQLAYSGYEVVYRIDNGASPGNGDVRNVWTMTAQSLSIDRFTFSIPGRETDDPVLVVPGSEILANLAATPWQNWLAALTAAALGAPVAKDGSTGSVIGGISNTTRRQRPRVGVRT